MEKKITYEWQNEAVKAIREYFEARDHGKAIWKDRIRMRKVFDGYDDKYNMKWIYTHRDIAVMLQQGTYNITVTYPEWW